MLDYSHNSSSSASPSWASKAAPEKAVAPAKKAAPAEAEPSAGRAIAETQTAKADAVPTFRPGSTLTESSQWMFRH
jgi:hypothetical protein